MPLKDQIKTVYVALYNAAGILLATTKDTNVSIVSFRYKFDDEDDDRCFIKLQTNHPKAFDGLGIGRGERLQIQWGYLEGPLSPVAIVVVKDITSKYGKDIIYTEIEASDYISYIKTVRSSSVGEAPLVQYIMDIAQDRYNVVIVDRGLSIFSMAKVGKKLPQDAIDAAKTTEGNIVYIHGKRRLSEQSSYKPFFDPIEELLEGTVSGDILDFLAPDGRWWVFPKNKIREYLEKDIPILTTNRSQYTVIQDMLKECPNGPWYVTGRGETLVIHNRFLGRKAYKSYTYQAEPGYLIDFTAKTKYENFEKQAISYAGIDPQDKKFLYVDEYRKSITNLRSVKEILEDKTITDIQKTEEIKEYLNIRYSAYPRFGVRVKTGAFLDPGRESQFYLGGNFSHPFINKQGLPPVAAPDATGTNNIDPYIKNPNRVFNPALDDEILRVHWFAIPMREVDAVTNIVNNRQRKLEMEKEEGKIIVEGDPNIQSGFNVEILNVHEQHEGMYYAKKAEHIITKEGFKVTMDSIKVIPEAMIVTIQGKEDEERDLEEQFKQERTVFGKSILVTFGSTVPAQKVEAGTGLSQPFARAAGVTTSEDDINTLLFEKGYTVDELTDRIIEEYKSPHFNIRENVNVEKY